KWKSINGKRRWAAMARRPRSRRRRCSWPEMGPALSQGPFWISTVGGFCVNPLRYGPNMWRAGSVSDGRKTLDHVRRPPVGDAPGSPKMRFCASGLTVGSRPSSALVSSTKRTRYNGEDIQQARGRPMPVHDWTRVDIGIFHDFHIAWIVQ